MRQKLSHGLRIQKAKVHGKLVYFINNAYKVVFYTNASDYAHGAYLCQLVPTCDKDETREEPIRYLSDSLSEAQVR